MNGRAWVHLPMMLSPLVIANVLLVGFMVAGIVRDAMKVGSYTQVKLANGKQGRSNAATSEREFFAELTRSFYGKSDYYPFVREELQQYDGPSARLIETAWTGR